MAVRAASEIRIIEKKRPEASAFNVLAFIHLNKDTLQTVRRDSRVINVNVKYVSIYGRYWVKDFNSLKFWKHLNCIPDPRGNEVQLPEQNTNL